MLEGLQEFYDTGVVPETFSKPDSPQDLKDYFELGIDVELERCPALALAALYTRAELLGTANMEVDSIMNVAALVQVSSRVLEGAARARGSLGMSPHRFPENVVEEARSRLNYFFHLHGSGDEYLRGLLNLTGYGYSADSREERGCLIDAMGVDGCTRANSSRGGEPGRKFVGSSVRFLLPRLDAIRRHSNLDPIVAAEAAVLTQLLAAADLQGIRGADAERLLTAACRDLVLTVPAESTNFKKLAAGARAIASAMSVGTRGQYAEKGKDEVVLDFVDAVGPTSRFFAEIGVGPSGRECNTRVLRQHRGWKGVMIDQASKNEPIGLYRRLVRAETIASLFAELGVPKQLDLLSIDIDGNDFWILLALLRGGYRPRAVIVEFLQSFGVEDVVARYSNGSDVTFARGDARNIAITGGSLSAFLAVANHFGYRLVNAVCCHDAFFVLKDLATSLPTLSLREGLHKARPVVDGASAETKMDEMEQQLKAKATQDAASALTRRFTMFFTTAAEALRPDAGLITVPSNWSADCLSEAMGAICDATTGQFCYAS